MMQNVLLLGLQKSRYTTAATLQDYWQNWISISQQVTCFPCTCRTEGRSKVGGGGPGLLRIGLNYFPKSGSGVGGISVSLAPTVGWAPWNPSCLEFKFDTRLSYWHKNKIGRIVFFLLFPDFAKSLPCWLAQFCWHSQQGRKLAKSRSNKNKIEGTPILKLAMVKR